MSFWLGFRRFWQQEEIPRWIGLSLVVLLTAGMGAASWSALTRAERESQAGHMTAAAGAAHLLGRSLAAMPVDDTIRQRCLLRDFARDFGCT